MKQKIFYTFLILILGVNILAAKQNFPNITLEKTSNIYAKTMLFYLPVAKKITHSYNFDENSGTFNCTLSIDKSDIFDKPVINQIFTSDISIIISNIPLENSKSKYITLPVSIRLNKKAIIKPDVKFKISYKKNKMELVGYVKPLKIKDITNTNSYQKRQEWGMPIVLDINYLIK